MMTLLLENFKKEFGLDKPKDPAEVSDLDVLSMAVKDVAKTVATTKPTSNETVRKVIEKL